MAQIMFLFIGGIAGALMMFLWANLKVSSSRAIIDQANLQIAKIPPLEEEKVKLYGQTMADRAVIETLRSQIKSLEGDKVNLETNLKKIITDVTNESLVKQGKLLSDQQAAKLFDVLNPLKEKIVEFEGKVAASQTEAVKTNTALMEQIKNLTNLNQTVTQKTEDLTNALRGSSKTQGGWGEMILERVLERSGLKKGSEYDTQFSSKNAHGETIRPDAVVYLPDGKNIIVDSKVSLTAYDQYVSATDQTTKEAALKSHLVSVRTHIKLLAEKDYHTAFGLNTPDFILMFVPIESGFALSVTEDASLFEFAWERKIVLVSPSTLLASLRTIASVWKTENQTRNAIEIANTAGDLYDKFVGFTVDMEKLGKAIDNSTDLYHAAMNKLCKGKGNLVNRANHMKAMGINATKTISATLVEDDVDS